MATYFRLLQFTAPYRFRLAFAMACTLLAAFFSTATIGLVAPVFDLIFSKSPVPLESYLQRFHLQNFVSSSFLSVHPAVLPGEALTWIPLLIASAIFFKGLFTYLADIGNNRV